MIGKHFCVCKNVVWSLSESESKIQDGMVILNVGMRKGAELKIVILILNCIGSVCLMVYDKRFGLSPRVRVGRVERGILLGRMIWSYSSANIRLLHFGMWLCLLTLILL